MTREEAIKVLSSYDVNGAWTDVDGKPYNAEEQAEAFDMAIEALEGMCFDEWCDDCKEYDTEKKCCPRFNKVIREALKREPSEDGTLEVKVEDATKIGRVLISDDKHRGGLYYPDEYEPKGDDLISRAEAIEALGEEPPVWCDEEYEIAERNQWRADIEAIKSVPSADRPRPIDPTCAVDLESGVVPTSACEPKAPKTIIYAGRIYADRPRGRWHYSDGKPATIGQSFGVICDQCGTESEYCTNFCGECGADMRGER